MWSENVRKLFLSFPISSDPLPPFTTGPRLLMPWLLTSTTKSQAWQVWSKLSPLKEQHVGFQNMT